MVFLGLWGALIDHFWHLFDCLVSALIALYFLTVRLLQPIHLDILCCPLHFFSQKFVLISLVVCSVIYCLFNSIFFSFHVFNIFGISCWCSASFLGGEKRGFSCFVFAELALWSSMWSSLEQFCERMKRVCILHLLDEVFCR